MTTFQTEPIVGDGMGGERRRGPYSKRQITASSALTLDDGHSTVFLDASGGPFTVTLPPSASVAGRVYHLKKIDSTVNTVTLAGHDSELIDNFNTREIGSENDALTLQSDGTGWKILGRPTGTQIRYGATLTTAGNFAVVNGIASTADANSGVDTKSVAVAGNLTKLNFLHDNDISTNGAVLKIHINGSVEATLTGTAGAGAADFFSGLGVQVDEGDIVEVEFDSGDNPGASLINIVIR